MKSIITILAVLTVINLSGKTDNYFINKDGEKVSMYKNIKNKTYWKYDHKFDTDFALTGQFFWYHDKSGNLKKASQAKIKEVHYGPYYYINKPIKGNKGANRLHEVKVQNNDYIATVYYFSGYYYFFVFDKQTGESQLKKMYRLNRSEDTQYIFKNVMKTKFKNCQDLLDRLQANMDFEPKNDSELRMDFNTLFYGITNYKCK